MLSASSRASLKAFSASRPEYRGHKVGRGVSSRNRYNQRPMISQGVPGWGVSHRGTGKNASSSDAVGPMDPEDLTSVEKAVGESGSDASLVPVLAAVCVASLGAFLFGYHLGVVNGPLEAIAESIGIAGNAVLQGSVVSTLLAGAAVGALSGGPLADAYGRRMTLIADTILLVAGALMCANAASLNGMLLGRLVTGLGIGVSSGIVPLYISEVAPTAIRGALGSVNQLVICIGILAALLVNVIYDPSSWRFMFSLASIPAFVLGIGMFFAPESPRWLASKGQTAKAQEVMTSLWGKAEPLKDSKSDSGSGSSISNSTKFRILAIGAAIFFFQQFSGINAIVYFSSRIFEDAGLASGAMASAAVGAINVLGTVVATGLMDRAGRKQLLSYSYAGMGLSMLAMAAGLALPSLAKLAGPIAVVGTLVYILCFGLGAGPIPALVVPELSPAELRGTAVSLALTSHWICNFGIGQLFLPARAAFGVSKVYVFFSAVCLAAIVFTNKCLVETKGRSLEEISKEIGA